MYTLLSHKNTTTDRVFGKTLVAAEQQRMKQLKKMQLLRRQAEQQTLAAEAQAQKEAMELLREKAWSCSHTISHF